MIKCQHIKSIKVNLLYFSSRELIIAHNKRENKLQNLNQMMKKRKNYNNIPTYNLNLLNKIKIPDNLKEYLYQN